MIVYRLCKEKYSKDLSGAGARKVHSNRWNTFGTPLIYTAESVALCAVELHQYVPPTSAPSAYCIQEVELPDVAYLSIDDGFYTENWISDKASTQKLGDFFVSENRYLILKVPSAWIHNCFNYLINPNHRDIQGVNLVKSYPFSFNGKLF